MASSAVQATFSSPELLEVILMNLPMQDLLVNGLRINRTWNATISTSPTLQQHLFFAPTVQSLNDEPKWTKNPLLTEKFPTWFNDIRMTKRFFIDVNTLQDAIDIFHYTDNAGPYKSYSFTDIGTLARADLGARSEVYCRPEASWRRMLVTQPPVKLLKIVTASNVRKRWGRKREMKEFGNKGGLRMGFVYDFVIEEIHSSYARFGLQWNMFDVEEDKEAVEDGGMDDYLYRGELIERNEERESVTLIVMNTVGRKRKNGEQLAAQFKCKAVGEQRSD
jgi:hypothetical protein